jgi:hypothetical protein
MRTPDTNKEILFEKSFRPKYSWEQVGRCSLGAEEKEAIKGLPSKEKQALLASGPEAVKVFLVESTESLPKKTWSQLIKDDSQQVRMSAMIKGWEAISDEEKAALLHDKALGVRVLCADLLEERPKSH